MGTRCVGAPAGNAKTANVHREGTKPQQSHRRRLTSLTANAALVERTYLDGLQPFAPPHRPQGPNTAGSMMNGPNRERRMLDESAPTSSGTQVDHLNEMKRTKRVPTSTCFQARGERAGRPNGSSKVRKGWGPSGRRRAALQVSQGGPPPIPKTAPFNT